MAAVEDSGCKAKTQPVQRSENATRDREQGCTTDLRGVNGSLRGEGNAHLPAIKWQGYE